MSDTLTESLKRAAAALEQDRIPYLLGGGLGCWARGGPPSSNDIDFMLRREDGERAMRALEAAGLRTERPPEQWLFKAWDGDVLVDLIFEPSGVRITEEVLERGEDLNVDGMEVRVMALDDIMVTKLLALEEHSLDYAALVAIARALREQIEWESLARRTEQSPYARAFFTIVEGLGLIERGGPREGYSSSVSS